MGRYGRKTTASDSRANRHCRPESNPEHRTHDHRHAQTQRNRPPHYSPGTTRHTCCCAGETSNNNDCTIIDRLSQYEERVTGVSQFEREALIPALALRSYHLPGYSYCDDWLQYFQNNHPIFGILCHHRLHPIGVRMRLLHLLGSFMFGLVITNFVWLWFYYRGGDHNDPAITINYSGVSAYNLTGNVFVHDNIANSTIPMDEIERNGLTNDHTIEITQGMVVLWTIGGALHAFYDNTVWYISACACCLSSKRLERYKCCGSYFVLLVVLLFTALATLVVLLRTSIESDPSADSSVAEFIQLKLSNASAYEFLLSYATELLLALLVYYPLFGTVLFCGILGCGNLPILGGRPYEVKVEERQRKYKTKTAEVGATARWNPPV